MEYREDNILNLNYTLQERDNEQNGLIKSNIVLLYAY